MRASQWPRVGGRPCAAVAPALLAISFDALAARPFVTDDARIVDPRSCQIESFAKRQQRTREAESWFLPGCNPWSNMELTAGGFRVAPSPRGTETHGILQAKTLIKQVTTNSWGLGFAFGAERIHRSSPQPDAAGDGWKPYLNTVASYSIASDAVVLHANLGYARDRLEQRDLKNWGLGAEIRLGGRWSAIVESYQVTHEKPSQQIGARYWFIPDRLQFDGTLGHQSSGPAFGESQRWISLGIRYLFTPGIF